MLRNVAAAFLSTAMTIPARHGKFALTFPSAHVVEVAIAMRAQPFGKSWNVFAEGSMSVVAFALWG